MSRRRLPRNNREVLDGELLLDGELAWDSDLRALRLGDGATVGGLLHFPTAIGPDLAIGDGIANDRDALAAMDAAGPWTLRPGRFRVAGANLTLSRAGRVPAGVRLIVDGVVLTLPAPLAAGDYQIFECVNGGSVAGLRRSSVAWFAGDLRGAAANARPLIQLAYSACAMRAPVRWDVGDYSSDGEQIIANRGQQTEGCGATVSRLLWLTSKANGIVHFDVEGPSVGNIGFAMAAIDTIATEGDALGFFSGAHNSRVNNVRGHAGWRGLVHDQVNGGQSVQVRMNDMMSIGRWVKDSHNIEDDAVSCSAFSDWFILSSTAGFVPGESVTWSTGNGSFGYSASATRAKVVINSLRPVNGTTLTGATSGATATIVSTVPGHYLGGLRREQDSEAYAAINCSFAGGRLAAVWTAATNTHTTRPEHDRLTNCYFDNSDLGVQIENCTGVTFTACWFACRGSNGVEVLAGASDIQFQGCTVRACWLTGLLIANGSSGVRWIGGTLSGNNRIGGSAPGVLIKAGASDWAVCNARIGGDIGYGGTQIAPWIVEAGASNRYLITGNLIAGNTGPGVDGGTGTAKTIGSNH